MVELKKKNEDGLIPMHCMKEGVIYEVIEGNSYQVGDIVQLSPHDSDYVSVIGSTEYYEKWRKLNDVLLRPLEEGEVLVIKNNK